MPLFKFLILLITTIATLAAHRRNAFVPESPVCDVHFPLSFINAVHLSGKHFWWAEGGVRGIGGESWHSIQTWFNTIEYGSMKVLGHVFDQTTGSNNTQNDNRVVLDIGSHQGWFSMVAGAYGIKAIAIDMQKLCVDLFRCSASLNRYNRHEIYHAYATDSKRAALNKKIMMPSKLCVGGTSPGSPGSAYSHLGPFIDVHPLDMGNFLTTQFSSSSPNIVLIKIDTEGYEPIILEAILDFCKHSITNGNAVVVQNFIIEVTSKSWASFEVTMEQGLAVFDRLYTEFNYKARWLPESDTHFTAEDLSYEANYTRFVELAKIDRLTNFWFFK